MFGSLGKRQDCVKLESIQAVWISVCVLGNSPFRVEINEQFDILDGNNYVFKT